MVFDVYRMVSSVVEIPNAITTITAMTMTQKNIPKMLQRRTVPVGLSSNSLLLE